MLKKMLPYEIKSEIESSDDEFYIEGLENDKFYSDIIKEDSSDIDSSSDSDIIATKRQRITLLPSSSSSWKKDGKITQSGNFGLWQDVTYHDQVPDRIQFTCGEKMAGPQIPDTCTNPIDFFKLFFTDELITRIVEQTNNYARRKIAQKSLSKRSTWHTWVDTTVEEFSAFIGVILNMGMITVSNIQEYWSQQYSAKIPFFSNTFRRERFLQIFWMLHLHENDPNNQTLKARTHKVSHYLDYLDKQFKEHLIPSRELTVDESIVGFKGKINFLTHKPNEPTQWGIRIYVMADANTGYVHSILPYYGSVTSEDLVRPDLPESTRIVLHFCHKLLEINPGSKGYHFYTNRYYTSLPLAEELLKLNVYLTGTIQIDDIFIPDCIKNPAFAEDKIYACRSGNLMLLAWKDKRVVTALTSWDISKMQPTKRKESNLQVVNKPTVVVNYDKYIKGIHRTDMVSASYCFLRKSLKWWRKLFFWGLEMSSINAYLLYKISQRSQNEKPMTHLKFVRELVEGLTKNFRQGSRASGKPSLLDTEERLNGNLHILRQNNGKKKDCTVCSNRKVQGGRRETRYICATCTLKPGLHIGDCFERYHTLKLYKTDR